MANYKQQRRDSRREINRDRNQRCMESNQKAEQDGTSIEIWPSHMQLYSLPMTSATSKSVQYLTAKAARWLQQTMPITSQNWATGKKYNSECIHQIAKLQRITVNNCVRFFRGHVVAQNQKRWAVKGFIMSTTQIPVPILVKSNGTTEGWICWVHPFYSTCASRDKSLLESQKSQNDSWKSTPQLENKRLADLPFPLLPSCHAWSLGTSTKHNQAYRTTEHWTSTDPYSFVKKIIQKFWTFNGPQSSTRSTQLHVTTNIEQSSKLPGPCQRAAMSSTISLNRSTDRPCSWSESFQNAFIRRVESSWTPFFGCPEFNWQPA